METIKTRTPLRALRDSYLSFFDWWLSVVQHGPPPAFALLARVWTIGQNGTTGNVFHWVSQSTLKAVQDTAGLLRYLFPVERVSARLASVCVSQNCRPIHPRQSDCPLFPLIYIFSVVVSWSHVQAVCSSFLRMIILALFDLRSRATVRCTLKCTGTESL